MYEGESGGRATGPVQQLVGRGVQEIVMRSAGAVQHFMRHRYIYMYVSEVLNTLAKLAYKVYVPSAFMVKIGTKITILQWPEATMQINLPSLNVNLTQVT